MFLPARRLGLGCGDHALQPRDIALYRRYLLKCRVDNRAVRNRRLEFVVNRLNFGLHVDDLAYIFGTVLVEAGVPSEKGL
jgi:hypothetical protein